MAASCPSVTSCSILCGSDKESRLDSIELLLERHPGDSQALVLPDALKWPHLPAGSCAVVFQSTSGRSRSLDFDCNHGTLSGKGWQDFNTAYKLKCGYQLTLQALPAHCHYLVTVGSPEMACPIQSGGSSELDTLCKQALVKLEGETEGPRTPSPVDSKHGLHARPASVSGGLFLLAGAADDLEGVFNKRIDPLSHNEPSCSQQSLMKRESSWDADVGQGSCKKPKLEVEPSDEATQSGRTEDHLGGWSFGNSENDTSWCDDLPWDWCQSKKPRCRVGRPRQEVVDSSSGSGQRSSSDSLRARSRNGIERKAYARPALAAKALCKKLAGPTLMRILSGSNVGAGSCKRLYLGAAFWKEAGSRPGPAILEDSLTHKRWTVHVNERAGTFMISSGWAAYMQDNTLSEGSALVLEVAGESHLKVHLFQKSSRQKSSSSDEVEQQEPDESSHTESSEGEKVSSGEGQSTELRRPDPLLVAEVFAGSLSGPCTLMRVTSSMVGKDSEGVVLPEAFSSELSDDSTLLVLIDGNDQPWPVEFELSNSCLLSGWSHFSRATRLQIGDVLVLHKSGLQEIKTYVFKAVLDTVKRKTVRKKREYFGRRDESQEQESVTGLRDWTGKQGADKAAEALQRKLKGRCLVRRMGTYCRKVLNLRADFGHLLPVDSEGYFIMETADGSQQWQIRLNINEHRFSLAHGWRKFAADNALQAGDVLVLEITSNRRVRVHLFRKGTGHEALVTSG